MLTVEPIARLDPPPRFRTILYMIVGFLGSLVSMAFSPTVAALGTGGADFETLHMFVSLPFLVLVPLALGLRHRRPVAVAIGAAVASILFPIGNTVPFIALSALIARRKGWGVRAVALLTLLTSATIVFVDSQQQPRINSLLKTMFTNVDETEHVNLSTPTVVLVILFGWGLSVGLGLMVRSWRTQQLTQETVSSVREQSENLNADLARQAERELIAREIHDGLGHRLSILNLHAGAMEAKSTQYPDLQASAQLIRETAAGAMDDLRSLLDILHPDGTSQPSVALRDLQRVVNESFGADQALSSSVFIESPDAAHPRLANAVYRIVQELLTNARKHAPGARIELCVVGGPGDGVSIESANPLPANQNSPSQRGSGRGLTGIGERVRLLGGTMEQSKNDGMFRVRVELPWMPR